MARRTPTTPCLAFVLMVGCLAVPPAAYPNAKSASAEPNPSSAPEVKVPAPTPDPGQAALVQCPLVTGKNQLCSEGLFCDHDDKGCERCVCKETMKSDGRTVDPSGAMDPRDLQLE